jgi:DNA-binding response OmpR family regulator
VPNILSISYDPPLLQTRHLLLESQGYTVHSVEGFTVALEACRRAKYDLVIVGHSIAHRDKEAIVEEVRKHSATPILALLRQGEDKLRDVEFSIEGGSGPAALLEAVRSILTSHGATAAQQDAEPL